MSANLSLDRQTARIMASKLLIYERPLQVLPLLAATIGLNEAVVLQQLHYWLRKSKNEAEGKRWVYNTYQQWQGQFPFWSIPTIQRIFSSLEKQGIVVARKMAAKSWNQRKWYSIDYDVLDNLPVDLREDETPDFD